LGKIARFSPVFFVISPVFFDFLDIERYLLIKLKALLKINLTLHPSLISNQNVFVFCHSHVHQYQQF